MRSINKIVLHHSITPINLNIKKTITSFNNTHKRKLHKKTNWYWYNIAYHFVISGLWEIVKTRPLAEIWYHASNWNINKTSIWICLAMNWDIEKPTSAMYNSLIKLLKEFSNYTIHWHYEFANKTCPWKFVNVNQIKKKLITKSNMYEKIYKKEVKKPLFNKHEWDKTLTEKEIKYLLEIIISRYNKKNLKYLNILKKEIGKLKEKSKRKAWLY